MINFRFIKDFVKKALFKRYSTICQHRTFKVDCFLASSPGLQLCGGKAWYRLHAHALDFRILCRTIVRKRTGPQYPYVFGFCRFCRLLAHAHAVDTRPSLSIIEGLGTRLIVSMLRITKTNPFDCSRHHQRAS